MKMAQVENRKKNDTNQKQRKNEMHTLSIY